MGDWFDRVVNQAKWHQPPWEEERPNSKCLRGATLRPTNSNTRTWGEAIAARIKQHVLSVLTFVFFILNGPWSQPSWVKPQNEIQNVIYSQIHHQSSASSPNILFYLCQLFPSPASKSYLSEIRILHLHQSNSISLPSPK